MKNVKKLWMRCGDGDDYNAYDNLNMVVEALAFNEVSSVERHIRYGVTDGQTYTGCNYISLYWGDKDAQPLRELFKTELKNINLSLKSLSKGE